MREKHTKSPIETPFFPYTLPDGKVVEVNAQKHLDVLDLIKRVQEQEGRRATFLEVILAIKSPKEIGDMNPQGIVMTVYHERRYLQEVLVPVGWTTSDGGNLKGQEATYGLNKVKETQNPKSPPKPAKEKLIYAKPEERLEERRDDEKPKNETSLSGSQFRTPEQMTGDKKLAFVYFTITVLSAIKGEKGLTTLSSNPHDIVKTLANGEHFAKILPQAKEKLSNALANGFETTINEILKKLSHKPRIELSKKESHISMLYNEIKQKNPNFQIQDVPSQLRKFFGITSSPAPGSPKDPNHS